MIGVVSAREQGAGFPGPSWQPAAASDGVQVVFGAWEGEAPETDASRLTCACPVFIDGQEAGRIFTEDHVYYYDFSPVLNWQRIPGAVGKKQAQAVLRALFTSGRWKLIGGMLYMQGE